MSTCMHEAEGCRVVMSTCMHEAEGCRVAEVP